MLYLHLMVVVLYNNHGSLGFPCNVSFIFSVLQAWQLRSRTCCGQKWLLLLLCPASLLFLTLCVMTLTLPLPLPPGNGDRRPSRALNSAGRFLGPRFGVAEPHLNAAVQPGNSDIRRGASKPWREAALKPSRIESKVSNKGQGLAAKRKEANGAEKHHASRHRQPKNKGPEPRITLSNRSTAMKSGHPARGKAERVDVRSQITAGAEQHTRLQSRDEPGNTWKLDSRWAAERHKTEKKKKSSKAGREQPTAEEAFRDPPQPQHQPSQTRKSLPKLDKASQSDTCPSSAEQDFSEGDRRLVRVGSHLQPLPWFSEDDLQKMALLAGAKVISKVKVPAHGQVLQVALEPHEVRQVIMGLLVLHTGWEGGGGHQDI